MYKRQNLSKVKGTGRKSRILKEDVQAYVKDALKRLESGAGAAASGKGDGAALGLLLGQKLTSANSVRRKFRSFLRSRRFLVQTYTVTG